MTASAAALQLRLDPLSNEARRTSASNAARRKSNSLAVPASQPPSGDAVIISLSARAKADAAGTAAASKNISGADAFLAAGENAIDKIDALVTKLRSLAQSSEDKLLDPTTSSARAQEAQDLLTEINTVVANAKYSDRSLVNGGTTTISYDLNGSDSNSANELRLTVANIGLSATQLGLNSLNGSSFTDSAMISGTLDTLEVASRITANTEATLHNNQNRISTFAEEFGSVAGAEAELPEKSNGEKSAAGTGESIADVIAQAAKTISDSTKAPELVRADLLRESISQDEAIRRTNEERSTGSESSATPSSIKSSSGGFLAVA